jgi:hypothetical protein
MTDYIITTLDPEVREQILRLSDEEFGSPEVPVAHLFQEVNGVGTANLIVEDERDAVFLGQVGQNEEVVMVHARS